VKAVNTMEVYFDNSATTKPYREVVDAMVEMLTDHYGNPSSLHRMGIHAERAVKEAREIIAKALHVKSKEIFFTSGGTESNNIAIRGAVQANRKRGNHLITSAIEHPSVLNTFKALEEEGYRVSYIPVNKAGVIDLDRLNDELCEDTILVSLMHVNNEIGSIQPIHVIKDMILKKALNALFHVDAVQSFGKLSLLPEKCGIDLLSVSAHKIHGPKGIGALYIKKGTIVKPIVFGGHQEMNIRSGTENVPGIVGFGQAVRLAFQDMEQKVRHIQSIRAALKEKIVSGIKDIYVNGDSETNSAPHILNVSFFGVRAEVLLHALEDKGIFVSTGSACSSNKPSPSHVLQAIGSSKECIDSAIRFSFSEFNTMEEVEYCYNQLNSIVEQLRKYVRR